MKLVALAVLTALAVALAAVAGAGPVGTEQRVAIKVGNGASFVLTPLTSGTLKSDAGAASFCCWTERRARASEAARDRR
jgi:2-keto-3-deoxy-6-phosphogluconate aldolase